MAITIDDFSKIWASTSPLTPYSFSESNYKEGWNFIGGTPPSRQMWDFLQKNNDEKMQYLADNYLPLSGGTMTGKIVSRYTALGSTDDSTYIQIDGGSGTNKGGNINLFGKDETTRAGYFRIEANDGINSKRLEGRPDGTLTWDGKNVERVNASGTNYIRYESGFQICWGRIGDVTTSGTTVTLPASFVGDYGITFGNGTNAIPKFSEIKTTSFKVTMTTGTDNVRYVAIGIWK